MADKPTPITLSRLDTPKSLTPQELEVINRNTYLVEQKINEIIAKLP